MKHRIDFRLLACSAFLAVPVAAFAAGAGAPHWGYAGHDGPSHWGELSKDYTTCGIGKEQSPINITGAAKSDLPAIKFDYKASALKEINNGHTVQVNVEPGSSIQVGERKFDLVQFHFHTPSEEQVNGKSYDAVWHLVHKDAAGKLGVVGVLVKAGKANAEIDKVLANLPKEQNKEHAASAQIDPKQLLPSDRAYYHFMGSLTTPPCSEGVSWYVLKQPIEASKEQVAKLHSLFGNNARPVQPLHARALKESK